MSETLGLVLVGLAGAGLAGSLLLMIRKVTGSSSDDGASSEPFGEWTEALASQFPTPKTSREELQQELWAAGCYRPTAVIEYLAVRVFLTLGALIGSGFVALLVDPDHLGYALAGGAVAIGLGYSLPKVWLTAAARSRERRIARALPVSVDLLGLSLSAGQSMPDALEQTGQELANSYPDMSEEFRIVTQHARLHSVPYALEQWSERCRVPEIRSLNLLLIQSNYLGTDTLQTLQEFNTHFRTNLRQNAEARANRASFWMLFPTIFCLWIAAAIILVGPPYLEFWRYREAEMSRLVDEAIENVETATPLNQTPTNDSAATGLDGQP